MPACGHCFWCQRHEPGLCPQLAVLGLQADGGLAEHLGVDAHRWVRVPDDVPLEVAGFAEPTTVAVRALRKVGDLAGARVAVVGLGTIGQLVVRLLAGSAAEAVAGVDPVASRRALAEAAGARAVAPDDAPGLFADRHGPDVVLECAGTERSTAAAVRLARPGGTVVLVGTGHLEMTLPVREVVLQEKRLLGTAGHVWDVDVASAVALLARGALDPRPLLSRTIGLDGVVAEGFEALRDDPDLVKIHVDPQR
jgi:threonine dehydrogenase-like Zn-dependent dehydrogenase